MSVERLGNVLTPLGIGLVRSVQIWRVKDISIGEVEGQADMGKRGTLFKVPVLKGINISVKPAEQQDNWKFIMLYQFGISLLWNSLTACLTALLFVSRAIVNCIIIHLLYEKQECAQCQWSGPVDNGVCR